MPRFPACSGAPALGTVRQVALSWPSVSETTGLSEAIPTSEPATAQISYTLAEAHLPTITGCGMGLYQLSPLLWCQVRNTSGSSRSVSWRFELNGASIATGNTTISNNYYGLLSCVDYGATLPVLGDVLTIKLWSSTGTGVNLLSHTMAMNITRPWYDLGTTTGNLVYAGLVQCNDINGKPSYGSGSADASSTYVFYWGSPSMSLASSQVARQFIKITPDKGLFIPTNGDSTYGTNYMSSGSSSTNASVRWTYRLSGATITPLAQGKF